jgi:RNA polymerase sigma factor (TIGR02999 family)
MTDLDVPSEDRFASPDVTQLLRRWSAGDAEALQSLFAAVEGELRRLASSYMRRERSSHTPEPGALVNEAYLRLIDQRQVHWAGRGHFLAIAAQAMRRVLVDHARGHLAAKRGGGAERVTLSGVAADAAAADVDALALHTALERLAALDARQAQVVEMRYFAGLSVEEVAEVLGISPATVKREWSTARVWLARALASQPRT